MLRYPEDGPKGLLAKQPRALGVVGVVAADPMAADLCVAHVARPRLLQRARWSNDDGVPLGAAIVTIPRVGTLAFSLLERHGRDPDVGTVESRQRVDDPRGVAPRDQLVGVRARLLLIGDARAARAAEPSVFGQPEHLLFAEHCGALVFHEH